MDRYTDIQLETIIPCHYCVAGYKKGKRKVQGVPQSQAAAFPRHQEEKETDKTKQVQIEQTYKNTKINSLFPKLDNHNAKSTEKHKNKIT